MAASATGQRTIHHEGERPMAIRWRLQRAIPGAFYPELALAV